MVLEWLEDFIAIVQNGTFVRAAKARHLSQPTLSRHIKLLEGWIGVPLFKRGQHAITLTPAGKRFLVAAPDLLRQIQTAKSELQELAQNVPQTIRLASTHALSLTFFPAWLRMLEDKHGFECTIKLDADGMTGCERILYDGKAQFLLCHYHVLANSLLNNQNFQSVKLRDDVLLAVSAPQYISSQKPLHPLPGAPDKRTSYLSYSDDSYTSHIINAVAPNLSTDNFLQPIFESQEMTVLLSMAREGRGVAWLPLSLIREDLESGRLVRADNGDRDVPIEIRLFRARHRQKLCAEQLWTLVQEENFHKICKLPEAA